MSASPSLLAAVALAGYLLGSIPFGLVLTFLSGRGDIRSIGSGNIGATNVLRTGSKVLAALTVLLDGGKGAFAVFLVYLLSDTVPELQGTLPSLVVAFFAVLGHNFPVWLKFKGGKGVATTFGVFLAIAWPIGLTACAVWLATAVAFRISSLAALSALACTPFFAIIFTGSPEIAFFCLALALLGFARHGANIRRLMSGREPKIGQK